MISVYKRHTPFSIVTDKLNFQDNVIRVPKKGDLLSYMYFTRTNKSTNRTDVWDPNTIDHMSLYIGEKFIDRQDSTFCQSVAPNLLSRSFSKSRLEVGSIFMPLQFWFCNDIPLPLVALQRDEVTIRLEWKPDPNYYYECWCTFIYLAEPERLWFSANSVELYIYQVTKIPNVLDITLRNPVKFIATEPIKLVKSFQYSVSVNGKTSREPYNSHGALLYNHVENYKLNPAATDSYPPVSMNSDSENIISTLGSGFYNLKTSSNTYDTFPKNIHDSSQTTGWISGGQTSAQVASGLNITYRSRASSNSTNAWRVFDRSTSSFWTSDPNKYSGIDENISGIYESYASQKTEDAFLVFDNVPSTSWTTSNIYGNVAGFDGQYISSASSNLNNDQNQTTLAFDGSDSTEWSSDANKYFIDSTGTYVANVSSTNMKDVSVAFDNNTDTFWESNINPVYGVKVAAGTYTASASSTVGTNDEFVVYDLPTNSLNWTSVDSYGSIIDLTSSFTVSSSSNAADGSEFQVTTGVGWSSNTSNMSYGISTIFGNYLSNASFNIPSSYVAFDGDINTSWLSNNAYGNFVTNGDYRIVASSNLNESSFGWMVSDNTDNVWKSNTISNGYGAGTVTGTYTVSSSSNLNDVQSTFLAFDGNLNTYWASNSSASNRKYGRVLAKGLTYNFASSSNTTPGDEYKAFDNKTDTFWKANDTVNTYSGILYANGITTLTASTNLNPGQEYFFADNDYNTVFKSNNTIVSYGNVISNGTFTISSSSGNNYRIMFGSNRDLEFSSFTNYNNLNGGNTSVEFATYYPAGNYMSNTSKGESFSEIVWNGNDNVSLTIGDSYKTVAVVSTLTSSSGTTLIPEAVDFTSPSFFGLANTGIYFSTSSSDDSTNRASFAFDGDDNTFWNCAASKYSSTTGAYTGSATTTGFPNGEWVMLTANNTTMIFNKLVASTSAAQYTIVGSLNGTAWTSIYRKLSTESANPTPIDGTLTNFKYVRLICETTVPTQINDFVYAGGNDPNNGRFTDDFFFDYINSTSITIQLTGIRIKVENRNPGVTGGRITMCIINGASYAALGTTSTTLVTTGARNQNTRANWTRAQIFDNISALFDNEFVELVFTTPINVAPNKTCAFYLAAGVVDPTNAANDSPEGSDGRGFSDGNRHAMFQRDDNVPDENLNTYYQLTGTNTVGSETVSISSARSPNRPFGGGSAPGSEYGTNRIGLLLIRYNTPKQYPTTVSVNKLLTFFGQNRTHPQSTEWNTSTQQGLISAPIDNVGGFFVGNQSFTTPITAGVRGPWIEYNFTNTTQCINAFSISFLSSAVANNIILYSCTSPNTQGTGYTLVKDFPTNGSSNPSFDNRTFTTKAKIWRFVFANTVIGTDSTVSVNSLTISEDTKVLNATPQNGGEYFGTATTGSTKGEWFSFNCPTWTPRRLRLVCGDSLRPTSWALFSSTTFDNQTSTWTSIPVTGIPSVLQSGQTYVSDIFTTTAASTFRFVVTSTNIEGGSGTGTGVQMKEISLLNSSNVTQLQLTTSRYTSYTVGFQAKLFFNKSFITEAITAGNNTNLLKFDTQVPDFIVSNVTNFSPNPDNYEICFNNLYNQYNFGCYQWKGFISVPVSGNYQFCLQSSNKSNLYINHSTSWNIQTPNLITDYGTGFTIPIALTAGVNVPVMIINENLAPFQAGVRFGISSRGSTSQNRDEYEFILGKSSAGGPYQGAALTGSVSGLFYEIVLPNSRFAKFYNFKFDEWKGPNSWNLYGNTGSAFTLIDSRVRNTVLTNGSTNVDEIFTINSPGNYIGYRLVVTSKNPTTDDRNLYLQNFMLLDTFGRRISPYFDNEYSLQPSTVEYMGSSALGKYVTDQIKAFGSGFTTPGSYIDGIYTGAVSTSISTIGVVTGDIVSLQLPYSLTVRRYSFSCPTLVNCPTRWYFVGWNGTAWIIIDNYSASSPAGFSPGTDFKTFVCTTPGEYSRYRLVFTRNNLGSAIEIKKLQFYTQVGGLVPPLTSSGTFVTTGTIGGQYEGPISTTISTGEVIRGEWLQYRFPTARSNGVTFSQYSFSSEVGRPSGWVLLTSTNGSTWTLQDRVSNNYNVTLSDTYTSSIFATPVTTEFLRLVITENNFQGCLDVRTFNAISTNGLNLIPVPTITSNPFNATIQTRNISVLKYSSFTSSNCIEGFAVTSLSGGTVTNEYNPCGTTITSNACFTPSYSGPFTSLEDKGLFVDVDFFEPRRINRFSFKTNSRRSNGLYYNIYDGIGSDLSNNFFVDLDKKIPIYDGYINSIFQINNYFATQGRCFHSWGYFYVQFNGIYTFTLASQWFFTKSYIWFGNNALSPLISTANVSASTSVSTFTTASLTAGTFIPFRILSYNIYDGAAYCDVSFKSPAGTAHDYDLISFNGDGWFFSTNSRLQFSGEMANAWTLYGSTNGVTFDKTLHTSTGYFSSGFLPEYTNVYSISTTDSSPVRRVRLVVNKTVSANTCSFSNFTIYDSNGRILPFKENGVDTGVVSGRYQTDRVVNTTNFGEFIDFTFPTSTTVRIYSMRAPVFPSSWIVYGSTNGVTFTPIHTVSNYFVEIPANTDTRFSIASPGSYTTYRIQCLEMQPYKEGTDSMFKLSYVQFFDENGKILHSTSINSSPYIVPDPEFIGSSSLGKYKLSCSLGGDPSPLFSLDESSFTFGNYNTAQGSSTGKFIGQTSTIVNNIPEGAVYGDWVQIELPLPLYVKNFNITLSDLDAAPLSIMILASNNSINWTNVFSTPNIYLDSALSVEEPYQFTNGTPSGGTFKFYRLVVTSVVDTYFDGKTGCTIQKWNLDNITDDRIVPFLNSSENDILVPNMFGGSYFPDGVEAIDSIKGEWIQINLPSPTISNVISVLPAFRNEYPSNVVIYGSTTNFATKTLITTTPIIRNFYGRTRKFYTFTNSTPYTSYRIQVCATMENSIDTHLFASASEISLCNEKNQPLLPFLISDSRFCTTQLTGTTVIGGNYVTYSSNTPDDSYNAFADNGITWSSSSIYNATTGSPLASPAFIILGFPTSVRPIMYTITNPQLKSWTLEGSVNNSVWTAIGPTNTLGTSSPFSNVVQYNIGTPASYKFFRFRFTSTYIGFDTVKLDSISFYDSQGKLNEPTTTRNQTITSSTINGGNSFNIADFIDIDLPAPETVNSYSMNSLTQFPRSWDLLAGSTSGARTTTLHSVRDYMQVPGSGKDENFTFTVNSSRFQFFRLRIIATQSGTSASAIINNFALYTNLGVRLLPINFTTSLNQQSGNKSLTSECLGQYRSSTSIPSLSSESFRAFNDDINDSASFGTYDGRSKSSMVASGTTFTGEWLELKLPAAIRLSSYSLQNHSLTRWTLVGSNDRNTWVRVHEITNPTAISSSNVYVPSPLPTEIYNTWRLIANTVVNQDVFVSEFSLGTVNGRVNSKMNGSDVNIRTNTFFGGLYSSDRNLTTGNAKGEFLEVVLPQPLQINTYSVSGNMSGWSIHVSNDNRSSFTEIDSQTNQLSLAPFYRSSSTATGNIYRITVTQTAQFTDSVAKIDNLILRNNYGENIIPVLTTSNPTTYNILYKGSLMSEFVTTTNASSSSGNPSFSTWTTLPDTYFANGVPNTSTTTSVILGAFGTNTPILNVKGEWVQEIYNFANTSIINYTIDFNGTTSTPNCWVLAGSNNNGQSWFLLDQRLNANTMTRQQYRTIASSSNNYNAVRFIASNISGTTRSLTMSNLKLFDVSGNVINQTTTTAGGSLCSNTVASRDVTTVSSVDYRGQWIQFQYASPVSANSFMFSTSSGYPSGFVVAGSTNGTNWNSLLVSQNVFTTTRTSFGFRTNLQPYSFFRFIVTSMIENANAQFNQINLFNNAGKSIVPVGVTTNITTIANPKSLVSSSADVTKNVNSTSPFYSRISSAYSGSNITSFVDTFSGAVSTISGDFFSVNFTSPVSITQYAFVTQNPTANSWTLVGSNDSFLSGNAISNVWDYIGLTSPVAGRQVNVATSNTFSYMNYRFILRKGISSATSFSLGVDNLTFIGPSGVYFNGDRIFEGTRFANNLPVAITAGGRSFAGEWSQIQLPSAVVSNVYSFSVNTLPIAWALVGSTNASTWDLLHSVSNNYFVSSQTSKFNFSSVFTNPSNSGYSFYRLIITDTYSKNIVISNMTVSTAAGNRIYPFLTSNAANYSAAAVPTSLSGQYTFQTSGATINKFLFNLFDMKKDTAWEGTSGTYLDGSGNPSASAPITQFTNGTIPGEWIDITLPQPSVITKYGFIHSSTTSKSPNSWSLIGSTDGITFSNILSNVVGAFSRYPAPNSANTYPSSNILTPFSKLRLVVSNVMNNQQVSLADFAIYNTNGRLLPKVNSTDQSTTLIVDTTNPNSEAVGVFGGRYTDTTSTILYSNSSSLVAGSVLRTFTGEWIQLSYANSLALTSTLKFIKISCPLSGSLPANVIIMGSNLQSSNGLGFTQPAIGTGINTSNSVILAEQSNIYNLDNTIIIPIPVVPNIRSAPSLATIVSVDVIRIIVNETAPGNLSTTTISEVELLDSKLRRMTPVLTNATSTFGSRTDATGTIIGNNYVYPTPSITGGSYKGTVSTGTHVGEWVQISFPFAIISAGYHVIFDAVSATSWTLLASNDPTFATSVELDSSGRVGTVATQFWFYYKNPTSTAYTHFRLVIKEMALGSSSALVTKLSILDANGDRLNRFMTTNGGNIQNLSGSTGLVYNNGYYKGSNNLTGVDTSGEWIILKVPSTKTKINRITITPSSDTIIAKWSLYGSLTGSGWTLLTSSSDTSPLGTFTSNIISNSFPINTYATGGTDVILSTDTDSSGVYNGPEPAYAGFKGAWAQVEYPVPTPVSTMSFTVADGSNADNIPYGEIDSYALVASNDYSTWSLIYNSVGITKNYNFVETINFSTSTYRYFRLIIYKVTSGRKFIGIRNLRFTGFVNYTETTISSQQAALTLPITNSEFSYFGLQVDRSTNQTTGILSISSVTFSSPSSKSQLIPPTPMTGNVTSISSFGDNQLGTGREWVQISSSGPPIMPVEYTVTRDARNTNLGFPVSWVLDGSNDLSNWVQLHVETGTLATRPTTGQPETITRQITARNLGRFSSFRLTPTEVLSTFNSQGTVGIFSMNVSDFSTTTNVAVPDNESGTITSNTFSKTVFRYQSNTYSASGQPTQTWNTTKINGVDVVGEWAELSLPVKITLSSVVVNLASASATFSIVGSNDGISFTSLGSLTATTGTRQIQSTSIVPYKIFRVIFTSIGTDLGSVRVNDITLFDINGERRPFVIPFCLKTNSLYHSGSLNFSMLNQFGLSDVLGTDKVYAVGHNILRIENGSGDVLYR